MASEFKKIMKALEKELDAKRYEHTLGVQYTAAALAMAHGASVKDAQLAGLLHDCAKAVPDDKKISLCEKYGLPIRDVERSNPGLLHAKLGSYLAEHDYGVTDPDILGAIEWHTTGKPNMSLLEKIVFVADYIEPSRKPLTNLDEIRHLAFKDIDKAIIQILEDTLLYLGQSGKSIDSLTEQTYHYYCDDVNR